MSRRTARPWTCGFVAAALFLGGCASQPLLETQAPVIQAVVAMPVLARNDVGLLYVFLPENVSLTPLVVVEHDSRRYVFLTSRVDGKSARLLPLVQVPAGWIAGAIENSASVQLVESFASDALLDQSLSGSFGIWAGAGSDIQWFGDVPAGRQVGLVVPVVAAAVDGASRVALRSLTETAQGIVEFEGNRVDDTENEAFLAEGGPWLVIPDGPVRSLDLGQWFGVECLNSPEKCMSFLKASAREDFGNASRFQIHVDAEPSKKNWTAFEYIALGRELQVNAFLSMHGSGSSVALGRMVFGRRDLGVLMPLGIGNQALELGKSVEDADITGMLAGLAAMLDGNLLKAAYLLRDVPFEVGKRGSEGARKGELQRLELLSAAGFSDWGRAEILRGRKTIDVQTAVALARSFVHELDDVSAQKYVEIALNSVGSKDLLARAEILQLKARVLALSEDFATAAVVAGDATLGFQAAERGLDAAAMSVEQAGYLARAGDVRGGLSAGVLGRDAFVEHASVYGPGYWAADAELRLATLMIDYDQRSAAMDLLESARNRLVGTKEVRLLERVNMVGLLVRQQVQPGYDAVPGLLAAYERTSEDPDEDLDLEAAGFAASVLINTGFWGEGEQRKKLVMSLVSGVDWLETREWSSSIRVALAMSCFRGLKFGPDESDVKTRFEAACNPLVAEFVLTPKILPVWIGQTYKYLQMGALARAEFMMGELLALQDDVYFVKYDLRVVEIMFLEAVLLERQSADETEYLGRVEKALKLLESSVEADAFSGHVFQYSEQFRVRGIEWLSVALRQKYVELAGNEQEKAARTVHLARLLHETGHWADLLELRVESSNSVESKMLALYRSDAAYRLGDRKLALVLRDQALKNDSVLASQDMFGLLKLAIQVDVRRGDLKRAQAVGEAVALVQPGDADVQSVQARSALAGLLGARGEVMAMLGKHEQAQRLFGESLAMFGELPVRTSASVRVEVLEAWGRTAQSVEQLKDAIEQLELFQTQLSHVFEPAAARDARVSFIRLALLRSDVGRAQYQFGKLMDDGLSSGATSVANQCLRARIGFHFLFESVSGSFGANLLFDGADGQEGLIRELRECAERAVRSEDRAEAGWMASLLDPSSTLAERLASTRAFQKALPGVNGREAERLKYFIELGTKKQESGRASGGLVSVAKLIRDLRPLDAQRVMMESTQDDDPREKGPDDAGKLFALMQTSLMLCRWEEAGLHADLFEKHVTDPKDAQLRAAARALAKRFSLTKEFEN